MNFTILRPQKEKKNQSPVERRLPHLPAQSALSSAFMVTNAFKKTRIWLESRFNDFKVVPSFGAGQNLLQIKIAE
jgi:hypothetical protein